MSACLCTHSFHDEVFNFSGVQRTKTEINVGYICLMMQMIV